jgi:hypothetical protein
MYVSIRYTIFVFFFFFFPVIPGITANIRSSHFRNILAKIEQHIAHDATIIYDKNTIIPNVIGATRRRVLVPE